VSTIEDLQELIIHPGLPKTATTTLQKHVFPAFPGYLGRYYRHHSTGDSVRQMQLREAHAQLVASRAAPDRLPGEWRETVKDWIAALPLEGHRRLIISDEYLSRWSPEGHARSIQPGMDVPRGAVRTGDHPMAEFLEAVRELLPDRVKLRIILTLRNQIDFLASMYAQKSRDMRAPGTEDFERKVAMLLEVSDGSLDYHAIVKRLAAIVHGEDLLVLLHEDGVVQNAREISRFIVGSPDFIDDSIGASMLSENRRSQGPNTWLLRPQSRTLPSIPMSTRPIAWFMSTRLGANLRRGRSRAGEIARRARTRKDGGAAKLTVTADTSDSVRAHCRESNTALAQLIGRDLGALGY
jgi:hypothetical protein